MIKIKIKGEVKEKKESGVKPARLDMVKEMKRIIKIKNKKNDEKDLK